MKIPFDIKFRPQIESGEYKVEIGENDPWPARIVCWDLNGNDLIVIISNPGGREEGLIYTSDGRHKAYAPRVDSNLFIVTPEEELTEFEKGIKRGFLCAGLEDVPTGIIKDTAKEIIELAKKEVCRDCKEYSSGYQKGLKDSHGSYEYHGPAIPAWYPPCIYGGYCTNQFHDCINCPRHSTVGINTTTGTSTAKVEG